MKDYSPEYYSAYLNNATGEYNHNFSEEYAKDSQLPIDEVDKERQEYRVFNQLNNKTSFY